VPKRGRVELPPTGKAERVQLANDISLPATVDLLVRDAIPGSPLDLCSRPRIAPCTPLEWPTMHDMQADRRPLRTVPDRSRGTPISRVVVRDPAQTASRHAPRQRPWTDQTDVRDFDGQPAVEIGGREDTVDRSAHPPVLDALTSGQIRQSGRSETVRRGLVDTASQLAWPGVAMLVLPPTL
jgi:hypothetical protein